MITVNLSQNNNKGVQLVFNEVYRGQETGPEVVRVVNNVGYPVTVWIEAVITSNLESLERMAEQYGLTGDALNNVLIRDTSNPTLLSLNGIDYRNSVSFKIDDEDIKEVFTTWRPQSNALPGFKEWMLSFKVNTGLIESEICDN
jgi:hypothetical protein